MSTEAATRALCAAAGLALLAGCDAPGDPALPADPAPGPAVVSMAHYFDEVLEATCEKMFACCSLAELQRTGTPFGTRAACTDFWSTGFAFTARQGVLHGYMKVDPDRAKVALGALAGLTCDDARRRFWPLFEAALLDPYRPAVAVGGRCKDSENCIDGYCARPTREGEELHCAPTRPGGAACDSSDQCAGGYCSASQDTCADVLPEGAACTDDEQCRSRSCSVQTSRCDGPPTTDIGVCQPPPG
jgi:hypothetical protein